jgi:hypothetical protein
LCPNSFTLDDGGTYYSSPAQKYIWKTWNDYWDVIWKEKKRRKWPLYIVFNGELGDDNYHPTTQLVTRNPADQERLTLKVIENPVDMADGVIVIRGTEAHSGKSGWMDEAIAQDLETMGPPEMDGEVRSWFHWMGELGGVRFDIAHHPGTGHARPWTKGGDANRLAAMLTYRYTEYNHFMDLDGTPMIKHPHLGIRGHNHKPSDSADNHPVRAIILPSWQLSTAFGHRLGGDWLPIGAAYVLCDNGEPLVQKFIRMWPVHNYWRLPENQL